MQSGRMEVLLFSGRMDALPTQNCMENKANNIPYGLWIYDSAVCVKSVGLRLRESQRDIQKYRKMDL